MLCEFLGLRLADEGVAMSGQLNISVGFALGKIAVLHLVVQHGLPAAVMDKCADGV